MNTIYVLKVDWLTFDGGETIGEFDNLHDLERAKKGWIQFYGWEGREDRLFHEIIQVNQLRPEWRKVNEFIHSLPP